MHHRGRQAGCPVPLLHFPLQRKDTWDVWTRCRLSLKCGGGFRLISSSYTNVWSIWQLHDKIVLLNAFMLFWRILHNDEVSNILAAILFYAVKVLIDITHMLWQCRCSVYFWKTHFHDLRHCFWMLSKNHTWSARYMWTESLGLCVYHAHILKRWLFLFGNSAI